MVPQESLFRHEKYEVWHKSVEYAVFASKLSKKLPIAEKYGLADQFRRSSASVAANIAEGTGRYSDDDFARFLSLAYGSLMESLTHLDIAFRTECVKESDLNLGRNQALEIAKMLSGLRKQLKKKKSSSLSSRLSALS